MHKEEAESYLHKKVEDGEEVSPVLPEGIKNYLIDIDGGPKDGPTSNSGTTNHGDGEKQVKGG